MCINFVFNSLVFAVIVVGRITLASMGEEKPDTLDFVKDFQEYLSQQTQHVNMISGSVSGVKEADELPPGNGSSAPSLTRFPQHIRLTMEMEAGINICVNFLSFYIC